MKIVKLLNMGNIITGKTPSTGENKYWNGNIPFLTPSDDMDQKYFNTTKRYITEQALNDYTSCIIPPNSICVSCIGSDLGKVVMNQKQCITNQQINTIIPYKTVNANYLYYQMLILGKELNRISKTSTAVPIINKTTFSNFNLKIHDTVLEQQAIADVLSSFDDKIELNNKIIKNLEEQSKQLFLFYLNHHATKKIRLVDLCENIKYGKFLNNEEKMGMYPVFGAGGIKGYAQSYDFRDKQLIIGCRGTCGNAILTPAFSNITHNNLIVETQNIYVIYNAIKKSNISSIITGSTQPQITINNLSDLEVLINEDDTINKELNTKLKYFYDKIDSLQMEIRKLAEARDYLLPKLMSGEIKVSDIK